jgi:hypothetical protein
MDEKPVAFVESSGNQDTFAPSIFAQASEIAKEENLSLSTNQPATNKIEIDEETAKIIVEIPFDISSYLAKADEVKLRESEAIKLAKLWRKPLERILSQYENSDVAIAALATLGIAGEKYAEYKLAIERRNRTRTAGSGENQQSETKAN